MDSTSPTTLFSTGAPKRSIPEGFPALLAQLGKEVIRDFPAKPADEAADAFIYRVLLREAEKLLVQRGSMSQAEADASASTHRTGSANAAGRVGSSSNATSSSKTASGSTDESSQAGDNNDSSSSAAGRPRLLDSLRQLDGGNTGRLSWLDLQAGVEDYLGRFGVSLDPLAVLSVAEEEEGATGFVQYVSFSESAELVVEGLLAFMDSKDTLTPSRVRAADPSTLVLLHGLPRADLEASLLQVLQSGDAGDTGRIAKTDMVQLLRGSGLGLTAREVNALVLIAASSNESVQDSNVEYASLASAAFDVLARVVSTGAASGTLPWDASAIGARLQLVCQRYEDAAKGAAGAGRLHIVDVHAALRDTDLGLSFLQLMGLLADAETDRAGVMSWEPFVGTAARLVAGVNACSADPATAARLLELRTGGVAINGLDRDAFNQQVNTLVAAIDPQGTGRALVDDIASLLLTSLLAGDQRGVATVTNMARALSQDAQGTVDLGTLGYAFDVLVAAAELEEAARSSTALTTEGGK